MSSRKADIILHPARMRILVAISGRQMTAQQLAKSLPDIPQTTLYRHVNYLVEERILRVVEERRVRGTVERLYELESGASRMTPEELAEVAPEDHLRYFSIFVTSLLADFGRYVLGQGPAYKVDVEANGVLYTRATIFMSDEERREFQEAAQALLMPLFTRQPGAGRRAYLFAISFFPTMEEVRLENAPGQEQPEPDMDK
jgi:DNA-binding transcriptional ArsR family regulator